MNRREELIAQAQRQAGQVVDQLLDLEFQVLDQQQRLEKKEQTITQQSARIAAQSATIGEQAQTIAEQQALIAQLQRMLFGPQSEKLTPEQEEQLDQVAGDLEDQAQRPAPDGQEVLQPEEPGPERKKRKRGGRHPMPIHLEVQTTVLEPAQPNCEHCGQLGEEIGRETSQQIDLVPAKLIVRRTVRIKRRCQCGCGKIAVAPLPPALLPSSKLGVGLAVFILVAKYDDHLALYTLERIFRERHGVIIPRQQMVQWIEHIAGLLQLIVDRMWARMKQSHYLQIDETPVKVLDPEVQGKAARGYLWFFAVPGGDVFLVFDQGRSHRVPVQALSGFSGTFQSDAYEVYAVLARKLPGVRRLGCAAHVRRRFYEAALEGDRQALWFIGQFRQLYQIEDRVRALPAPERQALRQARAPQIWSALKDRAEQLQPKLLPQTTLGKAIRYFLNEYDVLLVYLESPEFQIDNNLVENAIRPSCVGKKRWLFIGHPQAGWRSAVIYSILQSCRRRGLDPQEYLTDILTKLPGLKNTELDPLLPENWKAARQQASG